MDFAYFVANLLPIITTIAICVIGYFLKGIDRRFSQHDKRIEKVEDEIKLILKLS